MFNLVNPLAYSPKEFKELIEEKLLHCAGFAKQDAKERRALITALCSHLEGYYKELMWLRKDDVNETPEINTSMQVSDQTFFR